MRIALFSDTFPPDINGVANSTNILFHELKKHGHEVYVVAPRNGAGWAEWNEDHTILRLAGIELKQLYGYVMTSPFHIGAMNEIKKLNIDVIHVQTEFGVGIFARMCARQLNIPLVSTYHTTYEDYTHYANIFNSESVDVVAKKAVAYLSRLYGDSSVEVIAPSQKTKDLLDRYHVRKDIHVVPTGLELDKFSSAHLDLKKREQIRVECNVAEGEKLVVYVGRIAEEKALDLVIRGFALAGEKHVPVKLMIVGKGPDVEKLKDLCKDLNTDRVYFAGPKPSDEVPDYYRAADAFVSASLTETQGMTFIEALASGLPLFARKDEVLADLLLEGETGWYFENEETLVQKLMKFCALDQEQEAKMHEECNKHVLPYSSETFYERAMEVYEKAINDFEHMLEIEDVQVKDEIVQLYLSDMNGNAEDVRLIISLEDYFNLGLRKGGRVSAHQLELIQKKENAVRAYQSCLRKIAVKDRTRKEIYDWLTKETDCSIEAINDIVDQLEQKNYLNDERYCTDAIMSMKASLLGPERISKDLRKKGIPVEMIEEKLNRSEDGVYESAEALAKKVSLSYKDDSVRMKKYKIKRKLMEKGYTAETADSVLSCMDFAEDEFHEINSLRKCAVKARRKYEKKYSSSALRNRVYRYCATQGYHAEDIYAILSEMEWDDD